MDRETEDAARRQAAEERAKREEEDAVKRIEQQKAEATRRLAEVEREATVKKAKNEENAANYLKRIKQLIAEGNEFGRFRPQKFDEKYPGTKAAKEAKKLLDGME